MSLHEVECWNEFQNHIQGCATCRAEPPGDAENDAAVFVKLPPMCAEGERLFRAWGRADVRAQQQEAMTDDLDDCAAEAPVWSPQI